jgi:hypothetical protein
MMRQPIMVRGALTMSSNRSTLPDELGKHSCCSLAGHSHESFKSFFVVGMPA